MLYELVTLLKFLPKITLCYVLFSLINGMSLNNIALVITIMFDLIDYIPLS